MLLLHGTPSGEVVSRCNPRRKGASNPNSSKDSVNGAHIPAYRYVMVLPEMGGHLWFYRIRSKISSIIESTIFTSTMFCSTLFLLYRIGSTVFVSTDVCSKQLMQPHDYCLQEYALQEHDLHPVGCKGMAIQPPSAAIKSARILSAATICTSLLPAGVRIPSDDFHSGVF